VTAEPKKRYAQHKASAKVRGIEFTISFDEWWALWAPHWEKRGRGAMDLCMCRKADQGAYEVGNVRIATNKENQHEKALEFRTRHSQRRYRFTTRNAYTALGEAKIDWARGRGAFNEYSEDEEQNA
jgi:hypothetical protein